MKGKLIYSSAILISALLFLLIVGTTFTRAQVPSPPTTGSQPAIENGNTGQGPLQSIPPSGPPSKSRIDGWFNRSGSGLFIVLTPFATGVTLLILLLLILSPFLFSIGSKRAKRGYFKTISYARQRRYA